MDVKTGADVGVDVGEGVAVGALVGARDAVGDGATEGVDAAAGRLVATAGVDVGMDAGEDVADGGAAGVRVAVGEDAGLAAEVGRRVEVEARVGSDPSPLDKLVVGVPGKAGVSVEKLPSPPAGVSASNAWAVAIRISSALFLCIARTTKNVNSTDSIAMANP
jgi:hypothetical protein